MAIRSKTKVRVILLAGCVLALVAAGTVTWWLVQGYRDRQALAFRDEGMDAFEAGDYAKALSRLGRYLQRFDRKAEPEAWLRYAQARQEVEEPNGKHLANAMARLKLAVEWHPQREDLRRELMSLYLRMGYNTEAADAAEALLSRQPDDTQALHVKAVALQRLNRREEALRLAERRLQLEPTNLDGHQLALQLMQQLEYPGEELIARAQALREAHPDDPSFDLLLGFAYALADEREPAIRWLTAAADRAPADPQFVIALLDLLEDPRLAQYGKSLAVLEKADRELHDVEITRRLMRRYWETGRAEELVDRLASIDPKARDADSELLGLRAFALMSLGRKDEAHPIVTSLAARPNDNTAQGWALFLKDVVAVEGLEPAQAVKAAQAAMQRDPRNPYVRLALGQAYWRLEEYQTAVRVWQSAARIAPAWAAPYTHIARAYLAIDRAPDALAAAAAAVERAPQSEAVIVAALARYANLQNSRTDTPASVLELVDQILQAAPREEQMLTLKAQLLLDIGRRDDAAAVIRGALEADPPLSEAALLRLALIDERGKLGLSPQLYRRSQEAHGLTPALALAHAQHELRAGRGEEGRRMLDDARRRREKGDAVAWEIAWARYLDLMGSPDARAAWVALGDAQPQSLEVQQAALRARSAWADPAFIDRSIQRVETLTGGEGLAWRLARARWLLETSDSAARTAQAVTLLNEVINSSQGVLEAHLLLARAYERLGNVSGAAEQLAAAANLEPDSAALAMHRARLEMLRNNPDAALEQLTAALRRPSLNAAGRRMAATLLAQLGRTEQAVSLLEELERQGEAERGTKLLLANLYRQGNQPQRAEAMMAELLAEPTPEVIAQAAAMYAETGRLDEARQALARLDRTGISADRRELILGRFATRFGSREEAQRHFVAATRAAPKNAEAWEALVRFYVTTGQVDAAADALAEATQAAAGDPALDLLRNHLSTIRQHRQDGNVWALALAVLGDPAHQAAAGQGLALLAELKQPGANIDDGLRRLRQLADQNVRLVALQDMMVRLYVAVGRWPEAAAVAERSMHASPQAAESARLAAETLAHLQRWPEALEAARVWRQRSPGEARSADLMIAQAMIYSGDAAGGLRQLEPYLPEVLAAPQEHSAAVTVYTRALLAQGQTDKAAQVLAPLLETSPVWRSLWINYALGMMPAESGAAWLERVAPLAASTDEQLQLAHGWAILWQRSRQPQHLERARAIADRASREPNLSALAWMSVGDLYQTWGDSRAAEAAYRRSLQLDPRQPLVQNNLAMVLASSGTGIPEALALAQQAAESGPSSPHLLDTLAYVQAKAGDYAAAVTTMKRVIALEPMNPQWHLNLARMLVDSGQAAEAGAALDVEVLTSDLRPLTGDQQRQLEEIRRAIVTAGHSAAAAN